MVMQQLSIRGKKNLFQLQQDEIFHFVNSILLKSLKYAIINKLLK